jgi:hypothetical protein
MDVLLRVLANAHREAAHMIDEYNADRTGWARFSNDRTLRFRLARSLTGAPLVIQKRTGFVKSDRGCVFLMLNPSTANAFQNDPTIRRGMGFGRAWGCDVYQAVNLHPIMSTDPGALVAWCARPRTVEDHDNREQIRRACVGARYVIAAWGTHGRRGAQGDLIRSWCASADIRMQHLGLTKDGHPKHPLYLRADTVPQAWTGGGTGSSPRRRSA